MFVQRHGGGGGGGVMKMSSGHVKASPVFNAFPSAPDSHQLDLGGGVISQENWESGTYVVFISPTYLLFSQRDGGSRTENDWRDGGGALLTHKPVNAVALSTFSSNENFCHLHINLISCVSPPLSLSLSLLH